MSADDGRGAVEAMAAAVLRVLKKSMFEGQEVLILRMVATAVADAVITDEVIDVEGIGELIREYMPEEAFQDGDDEDFDDVCVRLGKRLNIQVRAEVVERLYEEDEELGDGACEFCEREMPLTAHHLVPRETHRKYRKKGVPQEELNRVTMICRPCHSAVHRTHDNQRLAADLNTAEKLLADDAILRFVKWASKQRGTRANVRSDGNGVYRR